MAANATLYVITGSHACRTGMLSLAHKRIPYRRVDLPTGLHPLLVRMLGFPGHATPIRTVNGTTHRSLTMLDRLGTVPALRFGCDHIQTNRRITRYLEEVQPEPALFPADPAERLAVEEAELWGDEVFQMAARRIALAGALHGLDALHSRANDGRLGPLLSRNEPVRVISNQISARVAFRAGAGEEGEMLAALGAMLEKIETWIRGGVLGGERLNAADLMIAPSLALIAYRLDLRADLEARPAGELLERVLPEPAASRGS